MMHDKREGRSIVRWANPFYTKHFPESTLARFSQRSEHYSARDSVRRTESGVCKTTTDEIEAILSGLGRKKVHFTNRGTDGELHGTLLDSSVLAAGQDVGGVPVGMLFI